MTKPCAPCAARLSIAESTFSPSAAPIFTRSKCRSCAACSANCHSSWNQGSSGCLTRKPSLMADAEGALSFAHEAQARARKRAEAMARIISVNCLWRTARPDDKDAARTGRHFHVRGLVRELQHAPLREREWAGTRDAPAAVAVAPVEEHVHGVESELDHSAPQRVVEARRAGRRAHERAEIGPLARLEPGQVVAREHQAAACGLQRAVERAQVL